MGKWKKAKRRRATHEKDSKLASASVLMLLLNGFLWAGLRSLDEVILTFLSALVAFVGFLFARAAGRYLRRHRGRVGGESMAVIGYWGNLLLFILTFLMFSYALAMGILRGDFLI